jgi:hypothetical protein
MPEGTSTATILGGGDIGGAAIVSPVDSSSTTKPVPKIASTITSDRRITFGEKGLIEHPVERRSSR